MRLYGCDGRRYTRQASTDDACPGDSSVYNHGRVFRAVQPIWRTESQLPDFPGSSPTSAGGCTVVSAANRFTQARTHHAARMSCQNDAPSATTRSPARIASPSSPDQPPATFSAGVSLAPLNNPPEAGAANCPASLELPGAAGEGSSGLPTAATGVGPWTCVTNCTERSPP